MLGHLQRGGEYLWYAPEPRHALGPYSQFGEQNLFVTVRCRSSTFDLSGEFKGQEKWNAAFCTETSIARNLQQCELLAILYLCAFLGCAAHSRLATDLSSGTSWLRCLKVSHNTVTVQPYS